MEGTGAVNDWLHETDSAFDWLCHELRDWLTEFLNRPEVLVTLTLAMGGPQDPPNKDAPFKDFAGALAMLLKNGYRDPRFILPVVRYLQGRRLDCIQAGMWTTGNFPQPTYNFEPSPRPPSPVGNSSLDEDLNKSPDYFDAGHSQEDSREGTPWTPPHTPVWVKEERELEKGRQEQKRLQEEKKRLREQENFRKEEQLREQVRLGELAALQKKLERLEEPPDEPPRAAIPKPASETHVRLCWSERLRQRPSTCRSDRSHQIILTRQSERLRLRQPTTNRTNGGREMSGLRPKSSRVTKAKAGDTKRKKIV
jgi:hypothetical protein